VSAELTGRAALRQRVAEITVEPGPGLEAIAHVICAMGGHIPKRDNESSGSCSYHRKVAAVALEQAGNLEEALETCREQRADLLELVQVEREKALRDTADELWRVFLRLPVTPSPIGDYVQRRVVDLRTRAAQIGDER
jgi:hypothetical protein